MEKAYKNCQSCGMPLKKDPLGGGSETDGSKSTMYCSYCYREGKFTAPDMTMEEMKALVKGKLKEMGFHRLLAGFFAMSVPGLKRWKN